MIGTLAVISILCALLAPKVFDAISNAQIDHTAASLNTVKTSCLDHFAKFGALAVDGSVIPPAIIALDGSDPRASQFDMVLMSEALLDHTFASKLGESLIQIVPAVPGTTAPDATNPAYSLAGADQVNDVTGSVVVEAVITDVALADARALNDLLDGAALGENPSGNDFRGRVKYAKPSHSNGNGNGDGSGNGNGNGNGHAYGHHHANTVDVYIYLAHH